MESNKDRVFSLLFLTLPLPLFSQSVGTETESCLLLLETCQHPTSLPLVQVHAQTQVKILYMALFRLIGKQSSHIWVTFSRARHLTITFFGYVITVWIWKRLTDFISLVNRKLGQANLTCLLTPQISKVSVTHNGWKKGSASCKQIHRSNL